MGQAPYPPLDGEGRRVSAGVGWSSRITPSRRSAATSPIKGEVSAPFFDGGIDCIKHRIQFLFDFMVPEAENAIALAGKPAVADGIVTTLAVEAMLATIELDDELQSV